LAEVNTKKKNKPGEGNGRTLLLIGAKWKSPLF